MEKLKNDPFLIIKITFVIILISCLFQNNQPNEIYHILIKTKLDLFLLAIILNNVSNIILTIKWYRLSKPLSEKTNFIKLLELNYISIFYSMFLPGQSAGEIIKGVKLNQDEKSKQKVWAPIFIDKITNLLVVLIVGSVGIALDKTMSQNKFFLSVSICATVVFLFISLLLFSEKVSVVFEFTIDCLKRLLKLFNLHISFLENLSLNYFKGYKNINLLMLETFVWSILVKIPHIYSFYFIAKSLNINLDIIESAWLFSVISITTLLPISFSGLGLREGAAVVCMGKLGIGCSEALSYSTLILLGGMLIALLGGLFELMSIFKGRKYE